MVEVIGMSIRNDILKEVKKLMGQGLGSQRRP